MKTDRSANEDNRKVSNEQLGAVYLKIDGLDKERFTKLTEGMEFYSTVEEELNDGYSYMEYFKRKRGFTWLSVSRPELESQLITLDELEERLFPFTLPEKWCIKITEESRETVKAYFDNLCPEWSYNYNLGLLYSNKPCIGRGIQTSDGYDLNDCTEITFEQFKKHVLKQSDMTTVEKKVYDYAVSVDWDDNKLSEWIGRCGFGYASMEVYLALEGEYSREKTRNFINKFKPKQTENMETKRRESLIKQAKQKYGVVTNISDDLHEGRVHNLDYDFDDFHYDEYFDSLHSHPEGEGGLVVYKKRSWAKVKEEVKEQPSPTFKVTRQALAEILPHVCSNYRDKINKLAQEDLFSNEVEVPESVVRQAHKDINKSVQKEWLDKYLPLPKRKKIEVVEVKGSDGFWTRATVENSTPFCNLKDWKNIVLIKENFKNGLDLIMCYGLNSNKYACNHFLGHFNEGNLED